MSVHHLHDLKKKKRRSVSKIHICVLICDSLATNGIVFKHLAGPRCVLFVHPVKTSTPILALPRCSSSLTLCFPTVSTFSEEGRQQAADHAAAEETLQEPNHPGLQNLGGGGHQHGRGTAPPSPPLSPSVFVLFGNRAFPSRLVAPPLTLPAVSLHSVTAEKALLCLASFHMTHGHRA